MIRRYSFRFCPSGARAACLTDDGTALRTEVWDLEGGSSVLLPGDETLLTQVVARPGGEALVLRHHTDRHELVRLTPAGEHPVATVTSPGFRLLAPDLALSWDPGGDTTLWRVVERLERIATVRGVLAGGAALDPTGRLIGLTRHDAGGPTAVVVDRRTGRVRALLPGTLLVADPWSGRTLVAVDGGLAHLRRHGDRAVLLSGVPDGAVPLAVAPGGDRAALQVDHGARSHLVVHDLRADASTEVAIPAGIIGGTAVWTAAGLRFPYSAPDCPSAVATTDPGRSWRVDGAPAGTWTPAHLERIAGTEAVVLGDWRRAERVVVALHGGPEAHWDLDFHPLLQLLARAGWAVVAPNQRGSTGYGPAHAAALHGAWGGADLDDVSALGRALRSGRPAGADEPALVGESYGAFLALLAAARGGWSRCAAIAPFLSGARLHAEASTAVRALVDRLGGREPAGGDVEAVAHRLRCPLLVVHGAADDTVPVSQSRRLRALVPDLHYLEIAGAAHDPLADGDTADALVRFLDGTSRPPEPRDRPVAVNPARP